MNQRREYVSNLQSYTEEIDKEVTLILQSLQWDKNHLIKYPTMVSCAYDSNHKIPPDKIDEHERQCFFRHNGYSRDEHLLPDPPDAESSTLVKLSKEDIAQIIGNASRSNPMFKKGVGCGGAEPMSLARLQAAYSADERRAIHDAVVSAVPSCHDLADLALPGDGDNTKDRVVLSRYEILAELRNMRRRRTKYRVAAKTRNYSDVLRDVIRTQMEHYNVVKIELMDDVSISGPSTTNTQRDRDLVRGDSHQNQPRIMPKPMIETVIKSEREGSLERNRGHNRERSDREIRHADRRRERHNGLRNRYQYDERSRERRRDKDLERSRGNINENSSSSRQHSDLGNRVKREPGLDYDSHVRNRDRRRRSKDGRHSTESYRDYDYEETDRSRQRKGRDYEDQVRREPRCDEPRQNNNDKSRHARRRENYECRERPNERIYVKQEREDSATVQDDRSYEISNRNHIKENIQKRIGQHGNGRHTEHASGSFQHRERSNERYDVQQGQEYSAIGPDKSTCERSKDRHKNTNKLRKKYREGRHYDEPDGNYRNREKSNETYIKQEEESPAHVDRSEDRHRKKTNKKRKKSNKDNEDLENSDRHRKRTKQKKKGSIREDHSRRDGSEDYRRDQRYDWDRSCGSESSHSSCTSEGTDKPRSFKRYYGDPGEAEYDPHKKIKIEK